MTAKTYNLSFVNKMTGTPLQPAKWSTILNTSTTEGDKELFRLCTTQTGPDMQEYYCKITDGILETFADPTTSNHTLHVITKTTELINLRNFNAKRFVVELNSEINKYYGLAYILVTNDTSAANENPDFTVSVGAAATTDTVMRFVPTAVDGNKYIFDVSAVINVTTTTAAGNNALNTDNILRSFRFAIAYNGNTSEPGAGFESYDPRINVQYSPIINLTIEGNVSNTYTYTMSASGEVEIRPHVRKIYINNTGVANGGFAEFRYDTATRYDITIGGTNRMQTTYNITNGYIYSAVFNEDNTPNTYTIPQVYVTGGRLVMLGGNAAAHVMYWVVEIEDDVAFTFLNGCKTITIRPPA